MRKTTVLVAVMALVVACGGDGSNPSTTTPQVTTSVASFPVTIQADRGPVAIAGRPVAIVSLSTVATEMLFEIGAGPQVIAVDDQSNYPADAPTTDLSGFSPNLEAILAFEPDLVIVSFDPGDLIDGLEAAGVAAIDYGAAVTVEDVYEQVLGLGMATGNIEMAEKVNETIKSDLADIVVQAGGAGEGVTYYHEIDSSLYTATSGTFFGEIYSLFGMVNVADSADEDGAFGGYPQLSAEYIVSANPDLIFLANVLYGENIETVQARPGWDVMSAVQSGSIVELDSDVASRWGPRIVDFARSVSEALALVGS